MLTIC